ncbi:hypothetical protein DICPUDRAFT_158329 [Dictyostelium purpureum]|uniref:Uncharacterized protein n=1 Tax=Dictyostelium purpureum TaxID=5786 RepID=F1A1C3_DICPU|nr:uncharacterized protein DICPUDRAFT_158329 [Dictyostelium purpureum]EGC30004.1 hypothetical protein DICPUDRAFT_158329 [Dictyostelium purpureum]|eukprot:XP_003293470.1 hypothetical protein DICPUDRAFT_158329 [Dictyostelium purpureum]
MIQLETFKDLSDIEYFPSIKKDCTEHCKKKMAKIVEITMKQFTEMAVNYYKDAKLGKDSSGYSYILYCMEPDKDNDPDFLARVENKCNIKINDNNELIHNFKKPEEEGEEEEEEEKDDSKKK